MSQRATRKARSSIASRPETALGEQPPVHKQHRGIDELQHMAAAPDAGCPAHNRARRSAQAAPCAVSERDKRGGIGEAADRHRAGVSGDERAVRLRQVDEEPHDRRQHADAPAGRGRDRRADGGSAGRSSSVPAGSRRRRPARTGRERRAAPAPARSARARAARKSSPADLAASRVVDEKGEDAEEPDHQREDDVDDEALVEKVDRPERRPVHAGNARQRQQQREDARDRQRADREPRPAEKSRPQRARGRCGGKAQAGGRRSRGSAHAPRSGRVQRIEMHRHHIDDEARDGDEHPGRERSPARGADASRTGP